MCNDYRLKAEAVTILEDFAGLCHVAVPRARSVGTSRIVRQMRLQSVTLSSRRCEARGAFGAEMRWSWTLKVL